jgi:DNA-binding MarR family transcriptional regulator
MNENQTTNQAINQTTNQATMTQACDAYELMQALMHAGKTMEVQLDAALASVGLSAAKWNALLHLSAAGGQLPLGQLATKLSCVKSNATQLVDRLEADELVCRLPDPDDRRSIRAEMTERGRHAYEQGQKVVRQFEQQLLDNFTMEEQLLLRTLLTRLSAQPDAVTA